MSTLGLIVEYNPFHNGHLFHLQQAKKLTEADTTIAVMSGSFLQRGEPALVDKWTRTKMALSQGIDLVIELPTVYATQAADWFAFGAVSLLHRLNADYIVFGSESNSFEILDMISDILIKEPAELKSYIKQYLSLGHSYPKALSLSLQKHLSRNDFELSNPNDILGIQYMLQIKKLNSSIKAKTIKRLHAQYNDHTITSHPIASATAIRKKIYESSSLSGIKDVVPATTYQLLLDSFEQNRLNRWDNFIKSLLIITQGKSLEQLKNIHGIVEGFEQRIKSNLHEIGAFDDLLHALKTKRYTATKIQRTLLNILLNVTKEKHASMDVGSGPKYIRVLGFNDKGRDYLNKIKHDVEIPLITNMKKNKHPMLELDITASMIYELGLGISDKEMIYEHKQSPVYI